MTVDDSTSSRSPGKVSFMAGRGRTRTRSTTRSTSCGSQRAMNRFLSLQLQFGFACLVLAAAPALADDFLPPLHPWHGASEALIARPGDPWITPSETTGLTETPSYDDTIAYLEKLDKASP